MSRKISTEETGTYVPNIERYFNNSSGTAFEEIITSIIKEEVDLYVKGSYDHEQVNVATSNEGVA
ncbi:hypothetical protein SAMN03159341_10423 [Paenibacillus sp. 1_12]|uniref:hypothetical protein n=1 Tax=Paenibacillus sp. 1_12 TaxID=1566278 RepID=UPI0008E49F8D|nr:hypothetical protein [Paenibacillus sp. 1_12]SFL21011.1 hypothetical protein SAMN03159341_10423 [Paenibacillus sp. 1_12]